MNKHQTERKIKLLQSGITEIEIARKLNVTRQAINNEMRGENKSRRIRAALADLLQTPEAELFPERIQAEEKINDAATN